MWLTLEYYNSRLDACKRCEYFVDEKCNYCGCYMKYKAILPLTICPVNKWLENIETTKDKPQWFDEII